MYGKVPQKETVYSSYVFGAVLSYIQAGQGAYTIEALAAACGLKPTHNFKRRVMQMVDRNIIMMSPAFGVNGRLIALFSLPEVIQEEMPF